MIKYINTGFFMLLLLTSCTSMKAFKGTADLHGSVYDGKNRPVPDCVILVDGKERALTDTSGRFIVYGLKSGTYAIQTKSSYCEKYEGELRFFNETQYAFINIVDNETLCESIEKLLEIKDYEKAEKQVFRLREINEKNMNAIMYLAVLRYKEKNIDAALRVLRDAEKQGLSDVWMRSLKVKLEAEYEKT